MSRARGPADQKVPVQVPPVREQHAGRKVRLPVHERLKVPRDAESFFSRLKLELVYVEHFAARAPARRAIREHVEQFHTSNGVTRLSAASAPSSTNSWGGFRKLLPG